jgi:membrane protein YqaA with SNARE-associated domain
VKPGGRWKKYLSHVAAIVFVIVLTAFLVINRDEISKLSALGYPGIFIASLLSSATLILPAPGVLFTAAMGAVFNPFWVAIAAGLGAALGELTGYIAGYGGQAVVENQAFYERVVGWMRRYGDLTILVLAIIPNPAFDVAGIAAGMLRMPAWRFLLWCVIGKIIKMMAFAYGGMALGGFYHGGEGSPGH